MASTDVTIRESTETAPPKRKRSSKAPRPGRQRSKIACRHCRSRKVRCDVYPRGAPCTNCHLDGIECILLKRKRKSPSREWCDLEALLNAHETMGAAPMDSSETPQDVERLLDPRPASPGQVERVRDTCTREFPLFENKQPSAGVPEACSPGVYLDGFMNCTASGTPAGGIQVATTGNTALPSKAMPSYIHCDLSNASNEETSHLQNKGCFAFPSKNVLDDLLKCYFDYIHPHVPFLDEQEFWETYLNQNLGSAKFHHTDGYQLSLLLFQAILFAATTCAPLDVLRRAGYTSRRIARRDAYNKVHALYSLDVEKDEMAKLQALLLMSFWRSSSSEEEDAWHWSGLVISVASSLCLSRQSNAQLTERQKTLRKRCWWSCVLRDRLLALSEQRAPRIRLEEHDVPLLTLADYNVGLRCAMSDLSPEEELGKRTALSMFSLQLVRLVLCIGKDGPSMTRDPGSSSPAATETWTRTRLATRDDGSMTGLTDLDIWRVNLPEVLWRTPDSADDDSVLSCILVHRNALQIYYHKLVLSFCVPRLLDSTPRGEYSRLAHLSSAMLSKLYNELVDFDSIHCLPAECLGPSTLLDEAYPLAFGQSETRGISESQTVSLYTSVIAGPGMVHPADIEQGISCRPSASGCSAEYEPKKPDDVDPSSALGTEECHNAFDLGQGGVVNEHDPDSGMNFVSDTRWALDDSGIPTGFPDLVAVDLNTDSTSDTGALTPLTLASFDALLPMGTAEFSKD